jgi:hypothetical protein
MDHGMVKIVKVKYSFKDGNEMQGIEVWLAPKVKKFFNMSRDNLEIMKTYGNGLADWYYRADFGQDLELQVYTGKDKTVAAKS